MGRRRSCQLFLRGEAPSSPRASSRAAQSQHTDLKVAGARGRSGPADGPKAQLSSFRPWRSPRHPATLKSSSSASECTDLR
eukprot:7155229-Alexandrium_andersonii.AAC.1